MSIVVPIHPANPLPTAVPEFPVRRLSVDQYHEMLRQGILRSGEGVELLEGWLVEKMTKNPPHRVATRLTRGALERVVPPDWYVDSQEPVTTDESEPEPDASVIRGETRAYLDRHPGPGDVGLVAEVSDESLRHDRLVKKRIYARARIPQYWIVNLIDSQVEVYSDPTGPADQPDYRRQRIYVSGEEVPVILDGQEVGRIPTRDLLP